MTTFSKYVHDAHPLWTHPPPDIPTPMTYPPQKVHGTKHTHPLEWTQDTSENTTFPQLPLRAVKMLIFVLQRARMLQTNRRSDIFFSLLISRNHMWLVNFSP